MGLAYLPDGSLIDYKDYINSHPHWQAVRMARFKFDEGRCVICRKDLHGEVFQTHHLHYQRLGNERLRDVITLCAQCHKEFHQSWSRSNFWKGKEEGHWECYSLEDTALLCAMYWKQDRLISRDPEGPNLCGKDACRQLIDDYFRDMQLTRHPRIDPNDISLFIRNKRYELFFDAERREGYLLKSSWMNITGRRSEERIPFGRKQEEKEDHLTTHRKASAGITLKTKTLML